MKDEYESERRSSLFIKREGKTAPSRHGVVIFSRTIVALFRARVESLAVHSLPVDLQ
jgi:hypothetical protein